MFNLKRSLSKIGIIAMLVTSCNKDHGTNPSKCPCSPGDPAITFSYVPSIGSFENLKGCVCNVNNPTEYAVAVYIRVGSGWWTKPYWSNPLTTIHDDGSWECDITTGGIDERATEIAAYGVPKTYNPPLLRGGSTFPAELDSVAIAKAKVTR